MPEDITRMSVADLVSAYRSRDLSPVEVTQTFLDRIDEVDPHLHSYVTVTVDLALTQAADAERRYRTGEAVGPLAGVPTAVKDAFHVADVPTTLGSAVHRGQVSKHDSGVVRRLREAGAVFLGKTNTAEFGQSATSENLLGPDTVNPWDPATTPGGSSGGTAAAMAARLATIGIGSDGGGSVRIPAAFCGIYGFKPTVGRCPDEKGFRGMTDFVAPGPMTSRVADARPVVSVLAETSMRPEQVGALRIGYCPAPEGRPVHPGVTAAIGRLAALLADHGHRVTETDLPIGGWNEIFGPLVLEDEHRERGHLLAYAPDDLTGYERSSLRAALKLESSAVENARRGLADYRRRIDGLFEEFDILLTPTVAVPAFERGNRPTHIDGTAVDHLWGAFPFAVPFNVGGVPAASVPCGLADGLPVGAQLVGRAGADALVLNLSQQAEEALAFDVFAAADRLSGSDLVSAP
ncbi:amidase [Gordonia sp. (in: high G+C Gram-positive bacteria)]|uniref:amidase n=1 Tax=Gordonia sp. (in: high G+C Gram-positive bacteria) TaxID=84139 RepID=UPI003C7481F6